MRMWMVPPQQMCRKHLLGEHVEGHMIASCLRLGKSLRGYVVKGLVETSSLVARHADLAVEIERRGYKHKSPLDMPDVAVHVGKVLVSESVRELARRCVDCRELQGGEKGGQP